MTKKDKIWIGIIILCTLATGVLFKINRDNMMEIKNPPPIDYKGDFAKRDELRRSRSLLIINFDASNPLVELKTNEGLFFDYKNNGFLERTKWVADKYGILVKDINGDGIINNGLELFGYYEKGFGGYLYTRGFNVLSQEDTNKDGVINMADKDFGLLKIWIDENKNANVEYNELFNLSKFNISEIGLKTVKVEISEKNPLGYIKKASKVKVDNSKKPLNIYEISLPVDLETTAYRPLPEKDYVNSYDLNFDLNLFGNIYTLKDEIRLRKDETLKNAVNGYLSEYDVLKREAFLDTILLNWTKSDKISYLDRGAFIDARKLNAYEVISGIKFIDPFDGDVEFSNPKEKDAEKLIAKYNEIKRKLRYNLSYNSFATEMLNTVNYNYNEEKRVYDVDISPVLGYIKTVYDIDNFKGELLLCDVVDVLKFTKSKMSFNKVEFNKEILDKIKSYGKVDGDKFQQLLFKVDDEKFYPFDLIKDEKPSELTMEEEKTPSIPVSDKIIDEIIENKEAISEIKKDEQEVTKEVKVKEVVENNENATEKALEVMEEIKQEEEKITK